VTHAAGRALTLTCPRCGLALAVRQVKGGTHLSYNARDWKRLCKYPELDSPVLCLLEASGSLADPNGGRGPKRPGRSRARSAH
jgi:hypothetical protein